MTQAAELRGRGSTDPYLISLHRPNLSPEGRCSDNIGRTISRLLQKILPHHVGHYLGMDVMTLQTCPSPSPLSPVW